MQLSQEQIEELDMKYLRHLLTQATMCGHVLGFEM